MALLMHLWNSGGAAAAGAGEGGEGAGADEMQADVVAAPSPEDAAATPRSWWSQEDMAALGVDPEDVAALEVDVADFDGAPLDAPHLQRLQAGLLEENRRRVAACVWLIE